MLGEPGGGVVNVFAIDESTYRVLITELSVGDRSLLDVAWRPNRADIDAFASSRFNAWPAGTTFRYRWLVNGKVVRKATSATLTIKAGLVGKRLSVRVTAAKQGYTSVALVSARTKQVVD